MPIIVLQILAACAATVTITTGLVKLYGHIARVRAEARARNAALVQQSIDSSIDKPAEQPAVAAPLEVVPAPFNNLPNPLNDLIDRQEERDIVRQLLLEDGVRLVTLTGPGGVGKTRLAIEAAREISSSFRDGVAFVSLAHLQDAGMVLLSIANELGVIESQDRPLLAALKQHFRAAKCCSSSTTSSASSARQRRWQSSS